MSKYKITNPVFANQNKQSKKISLKERITKKITIVKMSNKKHNKIIKIKIRSFNLMFSHYTSRNLNFAKPIT